MIDSGELGNAVKVALPCLADGRARKWRQLHLRWSWNFKLLNDEGNSPHSSTYENRVQTESEEQICAQVINVGVDCMRDLLSVMQKYKHTLYMTSNGLDVMHGPQKATQVDHNL